MKMHDFDNGYEEAIKNLKRLNNTADDSVIYECYACISTTSSEFSFIIGKRKSIIGTNETCIRIKNYIDDEMIDMDIIDVSSITAVHYTFVCTKK